MGQLKEYKHLTEKNGFFTCHKIDSEQDLELFFRTDDSKSIWRGSTEAKYKIYTSLQRHWIINDFPDDIGKVKDYLKVIIKYARTWNNGFLQKYFENYGIFSISHYAILSILRHHGTPTPLLDFTYNKLIALFFAASAKDNDEMKDEINSYFSVYELKESHPSYQFDSKNLSYEFYKEQEPRLRELNQEHKDDPDFLKTFYQAYINDDKFFYMNIGKPPIFKVQDTKGDEVFYHIKNNYNITNQEGLFIANLVPTAPLEEALVNRVREMGIKGKKLVPEIAEAVNKNKLHFHCFDINKGLKGYILTKLADKYGINNGFIYPNLWTLGDESYKTFRP